MKKYSGSKAIYIGLLLGYRGHIWVEVTWVPMTFEKNLTYEINAFTARYVNGGYPRNKNSVRGEYGESNLICHAYMEE